MDVEYGKVYCLCVIRCVVSERGRAEKGWVTDKGEEKEWKEGDRRE